MSKIYKPEIRSLELLSYRDTGIKGSHGYEVCSRLGDGTDLYFDILTQSSTEYQITGLPDWLGGDNLTIRHPTDPIAPETVANYAIGAIQTLPDGCSVEYSDPKCDPGSRHYDVASFTSGDRKKAVGNLCRYSNPVIPYGW